jgi:hypothetical protein
MVACPRDSVLLLPVLTVLLVAAGPVSAQGPSPAPDDISSQPLVLRDFNLYAETGRSSALAGQSPRIRLFRMPSGFLADPIAFEDEDVPNSDGAAILGRDGYDPELDGRVQLSMGLDNPYFDFRRPGDPGGIGYYKLHTQYQLLGGEKTEISLVLRAVAPAGLDCDGVASGATVFSPSVAWFQEIRDGTAVQGFIGKDVPANARWVASVQRGFQYGVGIQTPLSAAQSGQTANWHFFIEALGVHHRLPTADSPANSWELLPGIHWRLTDDCWLSGGFSFPVGADAYDSKLWQITCSWEY